MLKIIICDDDDFTIKLIHGLMDRAIEISKTEAKIVCKASSGIDILSKKPLALIFIFLILILGKRS